MVKARDLKTTCLKGIIIMYDNYSYIQGWKTNSRCTGKGAVTSFFFFKADICTLIGLKSEKKIKK